MAKKKHASVEDVKEMALEEKYDRALDYFTMDHAISYITHKENGTLDKWVDATIEAYRKAAPRFMAPLAKIVGKIAPNLSLKQALKQVVCAEQQMHDISEFEVSMPEEGTICIRFSNCDRYRRQKETVKRMDLKIEPRDICEVERLHHFHPRHPMQDAGVTPIDVKGEDTGCVWTFKRQ